MADFYLVVSITAKNILLTAYQLRTLSSPGVAARNDVRLSRLTEKGSKMQVPLQIAFEGVEHSETIETWIRDEAKKLDHIDAHITSARVVVAKPRNRHYTGDPYRIRIHLTVPGSADINVTHDPG